MSNRRFFWRLSFPAALILLTPAILCADTILPRVSPSLALVTSLGNLNSNDWTDWSQLGADQTVIPPTFTATSAAGVTISGTFQGGNAGGLTSVVCPAPPAPFTFPCSWTGALGGTTPFALSDTVIWTFDGTNSNGPLSLHFGAQVSGAGLLIQSEYPGQFTAQISAGGSTFTEPSDANGDPLFIGIAGTGGLTFNTVVFSLTKCTASAPASPCDGNDFAVDTLYSSGGPCIPEPAFLVPLLLALGVLFWRRRSPPFFPSPTSRSRRPS